MKKLFPLVGLGLSISLLTACSRAPKTVEGIVVGEKEYEPSYLQRTLNNIPRGRGYTLRDQGGNFYLAFVKNGQDPLNEGDKGSFNLGEKFFEGSFELDEEGIFRTHKISARKLDSYSLD